MVPTQFHRMLALPPEVRAKYDCSSTRTMVHAAAPCPPDVQRRMLDWWGDSIFEYYAATEGGGTLVTPQEWRVHPGTVGRAWPGAEIKIFDDAGQELPVGQQGTVYMRLGQADFEYHKDSEKTRKNRIGNYFTVGDVGYLNDEGYLFLCDRKIDMIISGGANIYPAEIEHVLITLPGIADCAVIGIPDEEFGEALAAQVVAETGATLDAETIRKVLGERIAGYKVPRRIDVVDALPRDDNGRASC